MKITIIVFLMLLICSTGYSQGTNKKSNTTLEYLEKMYPEESKRIDDALNRAYERSRKKKSVKEPQRSGVSIERANSKKRAVSTIGAGSVKSTVRYSNSGGSYGNSYSSKSYSSDSSDDDSDDSCSESSSRSSCNSRNELNPRHVAEAQRDIEVWNDIEEKMQERIQEADNWRPTRDVKEIMADLRGGVTGNIDDGVEPVEENRPKGIKIPLLSGIIVDDEAEETHTEVNKLRTSGFPSYSNSETRWLHVLSSVSNKDSYITVENDSNGNFVSVIHETIKTNDIGPASKEQENNTQDYTNEGNPTDFSAVTTEKRPVGRASGGFIPPEDNSQLNNIPDEDPSSKDDVAENQQQQKDASISVDPDPENIKTSPHGKLEPFSKPRVISSDELDGDLERLYAHARDQMENERIEEYISKIREINKSGSNAERAKKYAELEELADILKELRTDEVDIRNSLDRIDQLYDDSMQNNKKKEQEPQATPKSVPDEPQFVNPYIQKKLEQNPQVRQNNIHNKKEKEGKKPNKKNSQIPMKSGEELWKDSFKRELSPQEKTELNKWLQKENEEYE